MNKHDFARQLRTQLTDTEQVLWVQLRAHRLQGLKFKRQEPLGAYIVDFICFEYRLIIELDGGQHASAIAYDSARDAWLIAQGFRVLRFWNNEVMSNLMGVLEVIAGACNATATPSPQPLPREGGGAKTISPTTSAPLPPRGGGAGGEGAAIQNKPTKKEAAS